MKATEIKTWQGRKRQNPIKRKPGKYLWSDQERDPEMLYLIERTNEDPRSIGKIADAAYLSPGTLYSAMDGDTRRPQNSTITLWAEALGLKRGFVDPVTKAVHICEPWRARIDAMKKMSKKVAAIRKRAAAARS